MSHRTAVPQVRFPDLTKKQDLELSAELHYLHTVGIPEKVAIVRQFSEYCFTDSIRPVLPVPDAVRTVPDAVRTVPAWKHVEDLQQMIERMQAIKEELEFRRI